jgi:DNA repair ATPase RecN
MEYLKFSGFKKILAESEQKYQQRVGQLALLERKRQDAIEDLSYVKEDLEVLNQVQILFTRVSEEARKQLTTHIEQVVTAALQSSMDNNMSFMVIAGERQTVSGAVPSVLFRTATMLDGRDNIEDPLEDQGGGSIDTICTALRTALLELYEPEIEGPLELDEVGKHISAEKANSLGFFLKEYAAQTGRQVLMITHNPTIMAAADKVIKVRKVNGWSEVEG